MTDHQELLALGLEAATAAARLLRTEELDVGSLRTKSSATDLVTELDDAAEALVVAHLLDARPDDGVLGEEGGERPGRSGVRWVIDPLDGTTNFVYGFPAYAVSVAAEVDGEVVAGVVVDVARDITYRAALGAGAFAEDRPLRVSPATPLPTALVGTGFSYDAGVRRRQAEVLAAVLPAVRDIRRAGAAALDLCLLAAGHLDGFWERGLAPWDRAAGGLIAAEAGAVVGLHGPKDVPTLVAAAPGVHDDLLDLLDRAGALF